MSKKRKQLRCGKCGRIPSGIREIMDAILDWDLDDEGYLSGEGYHNPGSTTGKLIALCNCGHMWNIRGNWNIKDFKHPNDED